MRIVFPLPDGQVIGCKLLWLITLGILLGGCDFAVGEQATPVKEGEENMVLLGIDFQGGFHSDTVALRIDGKQVFLQENITTSLLLGLAESFTTEVEIGTVLIEISIETRDLTKTLSLDVSTDTYLGVSIVNGQIEVSPPRDEPFGYG